MKTTLNTYEITNALFNDKNADWSYNGAQALAEYLEQYEGDCGRELELDIVALRCELSEWDTLEGWGHSYFTNKEFKSLFENLDEEDLDEAISQYIEDRGILIEFEGGVIVGEF